MLRSIVLNSAAKRDAGVQGIRGSSESGPNDRGPGAHGLERRADPLGRRAGDWLGARGGRRGRRDLRRHRQRGSQILRSADVIEEPSPKLEEVQTQLRRVGLQLQQMHISYPILGVVFRSSRAKRQRALRLDPRREKR